MRLAEITSGCRETGRELLLFCARGCFTGLGVGFFIFLRLGTPATHELSGFMVGLFLMAALKLWFSWWVFPSLIFSIIHLSRNSSSPSPTHHPAHPRHALPC